MYHRCTLVSHYKLQCEHVADKRQSQSSANRDADAAARSNPLENRHRLIISWHIFVAIFYHLQKF